MRAGWLAGLECAMSDKAGKSGGASGFLPGLVLGVIVGAVTAFVALEVLDSPKIDVDANPAAATGDRIGREAEDAREQLDEVVEEGADAVEDGVDAAEDALENAADEGKALLDPPGGDGDD